MLCPNFDGCPFINSMENDSMKKIDYYIIKYCKGDYERCARYIACMKDEEVPDELKPEEN